MGFMTMKHIRGTRAPVTFLDYLLLRAGQESPVGKLYWDRFCCVQLFQFIAHEGTVLTAPPGARPTRRPGRWDKCDWSESQPHETKLLSMGYENTHWKRKLCIT